MQVDCATRASLPAPSEPAPSGPPQLAMLPTNASSSPSWLAAAAAAKATAAVPVNSTLYLQYNQPSPLSLLPCASLPVANSSVAAPCAAAAFDTSSGADLCGLIWVQDVSMIADQAKCSASSLTLGTCLPGQYTLQYTVTNAAGQSVSAFLLVLVETLASAGFSYTFTPPDRYVQGGAPLVYALVHHPLIVCRVYFTLLISHSLM